MMDPTMSVYVYTQTGAVTLGGTTHTIAAPLGLERTNEKGSLATKAMLMSSAVYANYYTKAMVPHVRLSLVGEFVGRGPLYILQMGTQDFYAMDVMTTPPTGVTGLVLLMNPSVVVTKIEGDGVAVRSAIDADPNPQLALKIGGGEHMLHLVDPERPPTKVDLGKLKCAAIRIRPGGKKGDETIQSVPGHPTLYKYTFPTKLVQRLLKSTHLHHLLGKVVYFQDSSVQAGYLCGRSATEIMAVHRPPAGVTLGSTAPVVPSAPTGMPNLAPDRRYLPGLPTPACPMTGPLYPKLG